MGRREIPLALCFVAGAIILLEFFFKIPALKPAVTSLLNWRVIVFAFTLALGAGNMIRIHGRRVTRKHEDAFYSAALIVSLFGAFIMAVSLGTQHPTYQTMWNTVLVPGFATSFSMTGFAITSAAYRAFRVRSAMAGALMFTAVLVMIGRVGLGTAIWPASAGISQWIMSIPNTAAMRGIDIGAGLGVIAVSLRVLLGLERAALGTKE